jgi:alpha-beta hydrolase superfamily lysophospholipase
LKLELLSPTMSDRHPLFIYHWQPEYEIGRGIVLIVHGLAEHAGRYEAFAEALTQAGYQVFAPDLRGHGRSATHEGELGWMGEKEGWQRLVEDTVEIAKMARDRYPQLPLYLFGHSLGSWIVQQILAEVPDLVDAAILSGPSGEVPVLARLGRLIARLERWRWGKRGRSELLNRLSFDSFNRTFAPNRTAFDWLSRDELAVNRYIADPACGFIATTQFWVDFLDAMGHIASPEMRSRIRRSIPLYLFSGRNDPVNRQGRGCERLAETYREMGIRNASYRLYPQARHECLHETNREEVIEHILEWLDCLRAYQRASSLTEGKGSN